MDTRKELSEEVKELRKEGKYAVPNYCKDFSCKFHSRGSVLHISAFVILLILSLNSQDFSKLIS